MSSTESKYLPNPPEFQAAARPVAVQPVSEIRPPASPPTKEEYIGCFSSAIVVIFVAWMVARRFWGPLRVEARTDAEIVQEKLAPDFIPGNSTSVYWSRRVSRIIFCVAAAGLVYAAFVIHRLVNGPITEAEKTIYLVSWTLGPPLFFFIETFLLFPLYGRKEMKSVMERGQEVAKALWIAIAVTLFALIKHQVPGLGGD